MPSPGPEVGQMAKVNFVTEKIEINGLPSTMKFCFPFSPNLVINEQLYMTLESELLVKYSI